MDIFKLEDITVKEISIVKHGANNKKFMFIKDKEGLTEKPFWMTDKEFNLIKGVDEKMPETDKTVDKTVDVNKVASDAAEILKKEQIEKDRVAKEAETAKVEKERIEKEQKEVVAKAVAEKDALAKELLLMKEETRLAKEEIAKARQEAKIEKDARILGTKVTFAKEFLPTIGSEDVLGKLLKEAEEVLSPDSNKVLIETLKSANEKIKSGGLFTEVGKDSTQTAKGGLAKIEVVAKEIMEKEKVDYQTAVSKAIDQNPKLYEEYESENKKE